MHYTINSDTLTNIANAIRNMRQETGNLTPMQIASKINDSRLGLPIESNGHFTEDGHWVRPNNYPDLDTLYNTIGANESCLYLTYDLTKTPGYGWIGVYTTGATFYVERGHISNGVFVADYTSSAQSSGAFFRQALNSANGDVQLWKIRTTGNITRFGFCPNTTTNANNYHNNVQPCVERCGRLPYVNSLASSASTTYNALAFSTRWLYRDHIDVGKNSNVTSLSGMYSWSSNLVETNCGEWDTSGWVVTNISSLFLYCPYIQVLDLSKWDTSSWKITSISDAWNGCLSLRTLNISTWDTSNWTTLTGFTTTWFRCYSLRELDLSGWDVSAWRPTSLASVWSNCRSLRKLNISTWDTSNWNVTTIASAWNGCTALQKLPIENWNVSNWALTRIDNAWASCMSLKQLDLSKWNTSNWRITTMTGAWTRCESLETLNISTWNTSEWAVTSISSTWNYCHSLKELNLSGWVTTNWAITTMASTWYCCHALRTLSIHNWNTANWKVTSLANTFGYCENLENFNFTNWDTSDWAVTSMYYTFSYTVGAKIIDLSTWNISKFDLADTRYMFTDSFAEIIKFPAGLHGTVANSKWTSNLMYLTYFSGLDIDINQNFSNSYRLTHDSLVSIINRLPQVNSAYTLTIGQTNKLKLTASEIAVATQKGWTVA